jgi:hypothetical protein
MAAGGAPITQLRQKIHFLHIYLVTSLRWGTGLVLLSLLTIMAVTSCAGNATYKQPL